MKRTTVAALSVLVLVALILLVIVRRDPADLELEEPVSEASVPSPGSPTAEPASAERTQPIEAAEPAANPSRPASQQTPTTTMAPPTEAPAQPTAQPEAPQEPPRASGPIEEMKGRLKSDRRDARAHEYEELIRRSFREKDIPEGLLESALCKQSVCRVSLRWSPDRHMGTMAGLMRLIPSFAEQVAFDPAATANRTGETELDVYFARKPDE